MVVICWSEQLLRRQFSKARADCCEGQKAFSIAHYFNFAFTAAFLKDNSQASTWSEDFIFFVPASVLVGAPFSPPFTNVGSNIQAISARVQRESVSRVSIKRAVEWPNSPVSRQTGHVRLRR
jgi:hypothetical protein